MSKYNLRSRVNAASVPPADARRLYLQDLRAEDADKYWLEIERDCGLPVGLSCGCEAEFGRRCSQHIAFDELQKEARERRNRGKKLPSQRGSEQNEGLSREKSRQS